MDWSHPIGKDDWFWRGLHLWAMIDNVLFNRHQYRWFFRSLIGLSLSGCFFTCQPDDINQPGALVPPTADQDPVLPQLSVTVSGQQRALHLQTFGNSQHPVAFILPGGPGADFRLLLPLQALSDRYFVVMWDPRGAGLSERVSKTELSIESFVEEIASVKKAFSPDRPVTLIGHSWGANLSLRFAARHPQAVRQLALIEPGGLSREGQKNNRGGSVRFGDGQDFFWQNELLTSTDHAAADYKAVSLEPESLRNYTCDGTIPAEPVWRFGAYQYYILTQTPAGGGNDFSWLNGLQQFGGNLFIVAGSCGAQGADFQQTYIQPVLPGSSIEIISGAGHISLFTDYQAQTIQVLRARLMEYQ